MLPSNLAHPETDSLHSLKSAPSFVVGTPKPVRSGGFVDRRSEEAVARVSSERRQFGNSHRGLSDDGRELALAIDRYKVEHHRRYLTCDEMLSVLGELGYAKN